MNVEQLTPKQRRRLEGTLDDLLWLYREGDLDPAERHAVSTVRQIIHEILDGDRELT